jgi:type III secretory pathway component EscS
MGDRSRYGLAMSALGASALVASVFLPWYRVSSIVGTGVGRSSSLTRITEHQTLPYMKGFLLVVAGLAMLDALLPLVRAAAPVPGGAGGSVALLGVAAAACVLYRILDPPALGAGVGAGSVTLLEGPWLTLLAALTMMLGGMWPRSVIGAPVKAELRAQGVWPGVPGRS